MVARRSCCRSIILVFLAFGIALVMSACSPSGEGSRAAEASKAKQGATTYQVKPGDKVLGNVEEVSAIASAKAVAGHLSAQGWAASCVAGAPLTAVTALIDGKPVGETKSFQPRPDVSAAFSRTDFGFAWSLDVPLKDLGPGEHKVTFTGSNATGDVVVLPSKPLSI